MPAKQFTVLIPMHLKHIAIPFWRISILELELCESMFDCMFEINGDVMDALVVWS